VRTRSLIARVVWGTVIVALLTAFAGATTAAFIARGLWQAGERRTLAELAQALAEAIERESREEGWTLERAAPEAVRESVMGGRRVEVWRGATLVAASLPGPPLGPPDPAHRASLDAWLFETRPLRGGLLLLVASPRERGTAALHIFLWSLVLSAPVCIALAVFIGRLVGRRTTQPLLDFRDRVRAARPLDALPPSRALETMTEVQELERSFQDLWDRLREMLLRELEFAANASHELRTPLTRIRLHAEGARGAGASTELLEEVDRMVRLVDSLLILARDVGAGIPAPEVVNLSDLVVATSRRVFASPAPEIVLPDEALVRGDEALLGIAAENLFDNARKFSAPDEPAQVRVSERDGIVRLTVTSPGARVSAEDVERLFERFYRSPEARASQRGHGLGLPLARHIARLHGGDVRCVSAPTEDARFELDLPAWAPTPREETAHGTGE
jgi:signal transduction histidine kinase